jgi:hypothetical protein
MENGNEIYNMECKELHRVGSLKTSATDVGKYKLDLVTVHVIR